MSDIIQECLWRRRTDPFHYNKREKIQHDIVQSVYGDPFFINALDLYLELEGHQGCVNTLFWSEKGDKLLSGSDDQTIRIWYPFENYSSKNHVIQTGHRGNIFSAKFMPHTSDSVVITAAADSEIRIFDLNSIPHISTVYTCHSDSVKRIGINNTSPYEFLTCSEDGTVRHFDTRFPHICTPHIVQTLLSSTRQWSRQYTNQHRNIIPRSLKYKCPKPLLDYSQYGLDINSMTVNKLRPQYFAIACMDDYMYLHDMRMIGQSFADDQASKNISLSSRSTSSGRSRCVKRFRPTRSENHNVKQSNKYVTACKFSDTNGDELLGSWAGEGVYLFNIHDSPSEPRYIESTFMEPSSSKSHQQYFESIQKPLINLHSDKIDDHSLPSVLESRLNTIPLSSSSSLSTKRKYSTTSTSKKTFYKLANKYREIIIEKVDYGKYPLALQYINDYYIELKYHCQLDLLSPRNIQYKKEKIQLNHAWVHSMRAIILAKQAIENITTTEKQLEQEDEKNFVPYLDRLFLLKNTSQFSTVRNQMMKAEKFASNNWRGLWCMAVAYWLICNDYENVIPTQSNHLHDDIMMNDVIPSTSSNSFHSTSSSHQQQTQQQKKRRGSFLKGNIITEYLYKVYKFSKQALSLLDSEILKLKNEEKPVNHVMFCIQIIVKYEDALKELLKESKKALLDMVHLGDEEAKTILKKINNDDDHGDEDNNNNNDDDSMHDINDSSLSPIPMNEDNDDQREDEGKKINWFKYLYPPSATWLPFYIIKKNKNVKIQYDEDDDMNEDDDSSSVTSTESHLRCLLSVQEVHIDDLGYEDDSDEEEGDSDDESNSNNSNSNDDSDDENDILRSLAHHHFNYYGNLQIDDTDDTDDSDDNYLNNDGNNDSNEDNEDDDNEEEVTLQDVGIGRRVNYYSNEALEGFDNSFFRSEDDEPFYGLRDLESQQEALRKDLEYEADVIGHRKKYVGHSNLKTIKDVNFYGCKDEYIVSGSDDGYCFIWDKETCKIVQILEADSDTVNIIQGHPTLPIMAVSGIDDTIKLFQPIANDTHVPSKSSKMDQLYQIIQNNHIANTRQRNDAFLTQNLFDSISLSGRYLLIHGVGNDDDDDSSEDDDNDDDDEHHDHDTDEHSSENISVEDELQVHHSDESNTSIGF